MLLKGVLSLAAVSGLGFFTYKTVQIYLMRRKYQHLPGPSCNGILGFYTGNIGLILKYLRDKKIFSDLILDLFEIRIS
jgi:hypothetical protein